MASKKQSSRGRRQDRARVAGGQDYEVRYEAKTTGKSQAAVKQAVKKVGNSRKMVERRLGVKMNPDREAELKRLAAADVHIADAERAVAEQIAQVMALDVAGQDTTIAKRELMAFQETLAVLQDYRASIVKTIERIGTGSP